MVQRALVGIAITHSDWFGQVVVDVWRTTMSTEMRSVYIPVVVSRHLVPLISAVYVVDAQYNFRYTTLAEQYASLTEEMATKDVPDISAKSVVYRTTMYTIAVLRVAWYLHLAGSTQVNLSFVWCMFA